MPRKSAGRRSARKAQRRRNGRAAPLLHRDADIISVDFRKKPNRAPKGLTLEERIDRRTDDSCGPDACWGWLGSRAQSHGYPQISYKCPFADRNVTKPVHRALMEHALGRKLARHEHVLHRRGCPQWCVNPSHHRVGSAQENADDAAAEGRIGSWKLKPAQVLKIADLLNKRNADIHVVADRFGISHRMARDIGNGSHHSKITGIQRVVGVPGRPFHVHQGAIA